MTAPGTSLATPAEVAAWLCTSEAALRKQRQRGTGPAFIKVGRSVRYAWGDVQRWALERRAKTTKAQR